MRPVLLFSLCIFFAGVFLIATSASAKPKISEKEKAVFAFYQLAEQTPDYYGWITSQKRYKKAAADIQERFYKQETKRLKAGFKSYNVSQDLLTIKTEAILYTTYQGGKTFLHFRFPGSQATEYPYFPYPYREDWIGLVVNDLGDFTTIDLDKWKWEGVKSLLKNKKSINASMTMKVKPVNVDTSKPVLVTGEPFWVMSGDIAYLEFETKEMTIYEYSAAWYSGSDPMPSYFSP